MSSIYNFSDMTAQDAIDHIQEHLTKLHANPNIYEDGSYRLICALEDFAIPALNGRSLPTRCRDCGYYHIKHMVCNRPCEHPVMRDPDDFCSGARRRNDDG